MKKTNEFYTRYIKRLLDIALSITAVLVLSPIALLCALAIKLDDPKGSILFRQQRNGKDGRVFRIIKFRTMKRHLSGGFVEPTNDTLTGVGRVLRKLSLDEIPQFISIIIGDMSLIGPRPLPLAYYESFNETERLRFTVKPGLTGLAQINGRATLNWDERFSYDVEYVTKLSFVQDLVIFFKTFLVVFSHKDVVVTDDSKLVVNFNDYRKMQNENCAQLELKPNKQ